MRLLRSAHDRDRDRDRDHVDDDREHDQLDARRLPRRTSQQSPVAGIAESHQSLAAVQMFADAVNAGIHAPLTDAQVRTTAARGIAGGGGALPHATVIQAAFGRHDISHVRAHLGGAATEASEAIGANAYASGDSIAFATTSPDLRLAAHEAAHIVQQRGGVSLSGGVGRDGDPYERHADAVADLVVRGESAEALLDQHAGGGSRASSAVQLDPHRGPRTARPRTTTAATPAEPRTAEQLESLIRDTTAAIEMNESGGQAVATPSSMRTSTDHVPASYASSTQMIASHSLGVLRGVGAAHAATCGVDQEEVAQAGHIVQASHRIWRAIVEQGHNVDQLPPGDLRLTGFTTDELTRMFRFGEVRRLILAQHARFDAMVPPILAWLELRATEVEAEIAALPAAEPHPHRRAGRGHGGPAHETAPEPAAVPEPAAPAAAAVRTAPSAVVQAALAALPRQNAAQIAVLTQAEPVRANQARLVRLARGQFDHCARLAAGRVLANEIAPNEHVVALGLDAGDICAFMAGRRAHTDFHRFPEDMNAWSRVALQHNQELHPQTDGSAPRTLDGAIASAVETGGGHDLSRMEFDRFIRDHVTAHPRDTDQQVVHAAAAHNGADPGYPATIWRNFQTIRRQAAATSATAPEIATPTAETAATPTSDTAAPTTATP